ncbi:hypothetical protein [Vibrio parahaemolyticus]|uniref:hypothetical protein n=1 Tax=Vibrio parahaemolyticus TaxID=670 RepID=UPI001B833E8A|nr:hypothetical protein [Vibrio parahaemolyticus]MCR9808303.1 hypothetical protein [Vibrio parahaemolyticus]MCR9928223.1 hypothetical protein [Vibrio parahaemolyticus]HBC3592987.1 hypothetical protein [Vibrio parahaemolyticus]HBC3917467.1 hypothetical protein [Vibrio parahaemolyticus]
MKKQVSRLSPHQNGKVFGILIAVASLPMFIPIVGMSLLQPEMSTGFPIGFIFLFSIIYLVFGYISVAIACLIYNVLVKYIGGFEFETKDAKPEI